MIDSKSLRTKFEKIDEFLRISDGTRYLVLFGSGKYDSIYDRIRYLLNVKGGITYIISHKYATIRVGSYDPLRLEKAMTLRNVIILFRSVWNKDKNNDYYNIFLEKAFYELPKK